MSHNYKDTLREIEYTSSREEYKETILKENIINFVEAYFQSRPDKTFSELEINGHRVTAVKDKLHNDSYITVRYYYKGEFQEFFW